MAMARRKRTAVDFARVHGLVAELFGTDMHAKRVHALANASLGVLAGASLGVRAIGQALEHRDHLPRHQGLALRHGHERRPHQKLGTARPAVAAERPGSSAAHPARGGQRA